MVKGRVILTVTPKGYVPADDEARAQHAKLAVGEQVACRIDRPRSLPQHNLYWAILTHVSEATEWETKERLHLALKIRLGLYDLVKFPNGKCVPVPDSISFDEMNQDEFQRFMDSALNVLCAEVLGGMSSDDLIAEVCAAKGLPIPQRAA